MNTDTIAGDWHKMKGEAIRQWGKLTNDVVDQTNGEREKLAGAIQKAYGISRDKAAEQISDWEKSCSQKYDA